MTPGVWTLSGRADNGHSYCFSHMPKFEWHIVDVETFWGMHR